MSEENKAKDYDLVADLDKHWFIYVIGICLAALMASCTAKSIYCDWFECKNNKPFFEMNINSEVDGE